MRRPTKRQPILDKVTIAKVERKMIDMEQTLKIGTLLVIETGEYSDRSWDGPVRMLKNATKTDLAEAYRAQWKSPGDSDEKPDPSGFLPWLITAGYAEHIENVHSWHVGSYGEFEP